MGNTIFKENSIKNIVNILSSEWQGYSYDMYEKNCNDFTQRFAETLLNSKIDFPLYVNRVKTFGLFFKNLYLPVQSTVLIHYHNINNINLSISTIFNFPKQK